MANAGNTCDRNTRRPKFRLPKGTTVQEEKINIALCEELAKSGYQCKIISSDHIHELQKETALILQGQPQNKVPQHAIQKLESLDMIDYLPVLGRNLRVLHEQLGTWLFPMHSS